MRVNPAPAPAENPVSGRITSEGRGGNRFSSAMRAPAPNPPSASITEIAHPAIPPTSPVVEAVEAVEAADTAAGDMLVMSVVNRAVSSCLVNTKSLTAAYERRL